MRLNELLQLALDHHLFWFALAGIGLYIWNRQGGRTGAHGTAQRRSSGEPTKKASRRPGEAPRGIFKSVGWLSRLWRSTPERPTTSAHAVGGNNVDGQTGYSTAAADLQGELALLEEERDGLVRRITDLEGEPTEAGRLPRESSGATRAVARSERDGR